MNQSGIWVEAEKAQEAAKKQMANYKKWRWQEYRAKLTKLKHCKVHWFWGIQYHIDVQANRSLKEIKKLIKNKDIYNYHKSWCQISFCEAEATCEKVIRACKVPPADGKIFLTLKDVERIGL